jgi:hypothetical protein
VAALQRHLTRLEREENNDNDDSDIANKVRVVFVCYADPALPLQRLWIQEWSRQNLWGRRNTTTINREQGPNITRDETGEQPEQEQDQSASTKSTTSNMSTFLLLDPSKSVYKSLAIPDSVSAAYGLRNLLYYAKALLLRRQQLSSLQGEAGQLGADFVLDSNGRVWLAHYCRDPTDRVPVPDLVQAVRDALLQK